MVVGSYSARVSAMLADLVYFDHNSTAPMLRDVELAVSEVMQMPLNASSLHTIGRRAKGLVEDARTKLRALLNLGREYRIVFTSSATEANSLAILGLRDISKITSVIEHDSVLHNVGVGSIPVNPDGVIDIASAERIIEDVALKNSGARFLVSVMTANNETGVVQPIAEIAELAHKYGGIFHTDATQAVGKIPLDFTCMDIDIATISGHKFGAPIGIGALIYREDIELMPNYFGGGQEYRIRPGTHNVPAIYGLGVACDLVKQRGFDSRIEDLRNYLEDSILRIAPAAIVFGKNVKRLPNTSMISMPDVPAATQVIHFDTNGIMVSAGSACSSGKVDLSNILLAMGYSESIANSAIRVSLGHRNNKAEIDKFVKIWADLYKSVNNF